MLRKGSCLAAERKQRLKTKPEGLKRQGKRRKQEARTVAEETVAKEAQAYNSKNNKPESKLHFMYNLVQGYVSAIIKLWKH